MHTTGPLGPVARLKTAALALSLILPSSNNALAQPAKQAEEAPDAPPAPAALPAGAVGGMGDINLFPKRVVIDDRTRIASVGLYNRAAVAGEYEITVSDMAMQRDGRLVDLATLQDSAARDAVHTASGFLRWSPRHVALPASEAQMVRIMARVPPDLPPGEYRSHFTVVSVPPETGGTSIDEAAGGEANGGIGVRIVPRFGISIPVIVRVGETTLTAGLKDLSFKAAAGSPAALSLTITRDGTRSAFGDIIVTAPGAKKPVAEVKGIGVYTEIPERAVQVLIDPATEPRFLARGTRWTVSYVDDDMSPGKVLARQEFVVP
ncbi:hypothetical protein AQZ52_08120 [Novosphingobium fuchskuhlense]|uniref:Pili assembly chaperone N-terminal domain-containing protein n=1 Tax=Novosphingobium fuchskuhlense TaxID=1117702 RepID=A0A117UVG5_9SPHN|nr:hypothetical protein [Novosphingobium fuchskuhlense]KUR71578.1 hypothetical protein AQZ52_08120 [Novosphingobium fuchskuhlense]